MAIHMPFDLKYWFVEVFAGDATIFMFIMLLAVSLASVKFGFPNVITLMALSILILMVPAYFMGLSILVAVIGGILLGIAVSRLVR